MLSHGATSECQEGVLKAVAEAAWALQAQHDRFLFKKARAHDHPSRAVWVNANNLWLAQVRARKAGRIASR